MKGWCDRCRSYQSLQASKRTITSIPEVLIVDPGLEKSPRNRSVWAHPNWVPPEIGIVCEGLNIRCFEGEQVRSYRSYPSSEIYELVGMVVDIASSGRQKHRLISFIDGMLSPVSICASIVLIFAPVAISAPQPTQQPQWHLFNDFMVGPVTQQEALGFAASWKTPVLLVYQKQSARHSIDDSWKTYLDTTCLYNSGSMK